MPGSPVADPPAVLGEAYLLDGVTVTPADAPFDDVGLAMLDTASEAGGISMSHRTLPLPSYAEVTALDSGRTILVRIERRGPISGSAFVALSDGAFAQLGADPAAPLGVRVRRVSPQEYERSLLRTGQRAAERLATPKSLLEVLRRRLADKTSQPVPTPAQPAARVIPAVETPSTTPPMNAEPAEAAPVKVVAAQAEPVKAPRPPATKSTTAAKAAGSFAVQVGAFANRANADATARKLGGKVNAAGKLWRVRIGPVATRDEAASAQTRARKAGFADAQIVSATASPAK